MRGATDSTTFRSRHPLPMRPSIDTNGIAPTVVEPAAVLPEQFFAPPSTAYQSCGEYALMSAVLEDALLCFDKQFMSHSRQSLQLAREAEEWIQSNDAGWLFAFVNVCVALGLDADSVRRQLTLRRQSATRALRRSRRRVMASQATVSLAA